MKKLLLAAICVFALAGTAMAAPLIANGDFSTGLSPWVDSGDVQIVNTPLVSGLTGNYALLGGIVDSGVSSILQSFTIPEGTSSIDVSFNYAFAGTDTSTRSADQIRADLSQYVEFQWWIWTWNDWSTATIMAGTSPGDYIATGSFSGTYLVDSDLVNQANNGQLSFVLNEATSTSTNSRFAIDNVVVDDGRPVGGAPVPEPASMMLLGMGILGLVGLKRKA